MTIRAQSQSFNPSGDEKTLLALMRADAVILRARRIPQEGREAIRTANRNRKSKQTVSPVATRRATQ
jgi:hypothetical protein